MPDLQTAFERDRDAEYARIQAVTPRVKISRHSPRRTMLRDEERTRGIAAHMRSWAQAWCEARGLRVAVLEGGVFLAEEIHG